MGIRGECRKFEPNVFNKQKCSSCYKLKEQHSEEALQVAKQARNISRCGYLFVAPDWDFTNPVYRTKRWQRRWFVLFDDGELIYSLDENPDTVPQAVINMNKVFEITAADGITGNANSIAIVAQDGIHFIKGSCPEESKLWLDILKLFSAHSSNIRKEGAGGRAKRSATFPGIRVQNPGFKDSIKKSMAENESAEMRRESSNPDELEQLISPEEEEEISPDFNNRKRATQVTFAGANSNNNSSQNNKTLIQPVHKNSLVDDEGTEEEEEESYEYEEEEEEYEEEETSEEMTEESFEEEEEEEKSKTENTVEESVRAVSTSTPTATATVTQLERTSSRGLFFDDEPYPIISKFTKRSSMNSIPLAASTSSSSASNYSRVYSSGSISVSSTSGSGSASASWTTSSSTSKVTSSSKSAMEEEDLIEAQEACDTVSSELGLISRSNRNSREGSVESQTSNSSPRGKRGVPDGGNLDLSLTSTAASSSLDLNVKKGWLMKESQGGSRSSKEWHKYWFVLQDGALMYYRDPAAETKGFLDGVIALNLVEKVGCLEETGRNFGFYFKTCEPRTHKFSAVTAGIRQKWVEVIKTAAHLGLSPSDSLGNLSVRSLDEGNVESSSTRFQKRTSLKEESLGLDESEVFRSLRYRREKMKLRSKSSVELSRILTKPGKIPEESESKEIEEKKSNNSRTSSPKPLNKTASTSVLLSKSTSDAIVPSGILKNKHKSSVEQQQKEEETASKNVSSTSNFEENQQLKTLRAKLEAELGDLKEKLISAAAETEHFKDLLKSEQSSTFQLKRQVEAVEKRLAEVVAERQTEADKHSALVVEHSKIEQSLQEQTAAAEKWKSRYENLYFEYDEAQERLKLMEREAERRINNFSEQLLSKDQIISDLSDQLKESEERIHDLLSDVDCARADKKNLQQEHEEDMTRLILAMESKFNNEQGTQTMTDTETEPVESHTMSCGTSPEPPPLMHTKSLTDALAKFHNCATETDETDNFDELCSRLSTAADEIEALKKSLREAREGNDAVEVEKMCLEQAFKRTVMMHEEQERSLVARVEDLSNKLYVSEKSLKQMKERRMSRKEKLRERQTDKATKDNTSGNQRLEPPQPSN